MAIIVHPYGVRVFFRIYPGLKPGANYVHPCGMRVVKNLNIFFNAIALKPFELDLTL
jgi:hypothetical protein